MLTLCVQSLHAIVSMLVAVPNLIPKDDERGTEIMKYHLIVIVRWRLTKIHIGVTVCIGKSFSSGISSH